MVMLMSLLEKLRSKGSKEILKVEEVNTDFGPGYKIDVRVGDTKKECHLIQDKDTGEWKTLGDPNACRILSRNLNDLGSPLTGRSTSEKLREHDY